MAFTPDVSRSLGPRPRPLSRREVRQEPRQDEHRVSSEDRRPRSCFDQSALHYHGESDAEWNFAEILGVAGPETAPAAQTSPIAPNPYILSVSTEELPQSQEEINQEIVRLTESLGHTRFLGRQTRDYFSAEISRAPEDLRPLFERMQNESISPEERAETMRAIEGILARLNSIDEFLNDAQEIYDVARRAGFSGRQREVLLGDIRFAARSLRSSLVASDTPSRLQHFQRSQGTISALREFVSSYSLVISIPRVNRREVARYRSTSWRMYQQIRAQLRSDNPNFDTVRNLRGRIQSDFGNLSEQCARRELAYFATLFRQNEAWTSLVTEAQEAFDAIEQLDTPQRRTRAAELLSRARQYVEARRNMGQIQQGLRQAEDLPEEVQRSYQTVLRRLRSYSSALLQGQTEVAQTEMERAQTALERAQALERQHRYMHAAPRLVEALQSQDIQRALSRRGVRSDDWEGHVQTVQGFQRRIEDGEQLTAAERRQFGESVNALREMNLLARGVLALNYELELLELPSELRESAQAALSEIADSIADYPGRSLTEAELRRIEENVPIVQVAVCMWRYNEFERFTTGDIHETEVRQAIRVLREVLTERRMNPGAGRAVQTVSQFLERAAYRESVSQAFASLAQPLRQAQTLETDDTTELGGAARGALERFLDNPFSFALRPFASIATTAAGREGFQRILGHQVDGNLLSVLRNPEGLLELRRDDPQTYRSIMLSLSRMVRGAETLRGCDTVGDLAHLVNIVQIINRYGYEFMPPALRAADGMRRFLQFVINHPTIRGAVRDFEIGARIRQVGNFGLAIGITILSVPLSEAAAIGAVSLAGRAGLAVFGTGITATRTGRLLWGAAELLIGRGVAAPVFVAQHRAFAVGVGLEDHYFQSWREFRNESLRTFGMFLVLHGTMGAFSRIPRPTSTIGRAAYYLGGLGTEVLTLTGYGLAVRAASGEDVSWDDLTAELGSNAVFVLGMRGGNRAFNGLLSRVRESMIPRRLRVQIESIANRSEEVLARLEALEARRAERGLNARETSEVARLLRDQHLLAAERVTALRELEAMGLIDSATVRDAESFEQATRELVMPAYRLELLGRAQQAWQEAGQIETFLREQLGVDLTVENLLDYAEVIRTRFPQSPLAQRLSEIRDALQTARDSHDPDQLARAEREAQSQAAQLLREFSARGEIEVALRELGLEPTAENLIDHAVEIQTQLVEIASGQYAQSLGIEGEVELTDPMYLADYDRVIEAAEANPLARRLAQLRLRGQTVRDVPSILRRAPRFSEMTAEEIAQEIRFDELSIAEIDQLLRTNGEALGREVGTEDYLPDVEILRQPQPDGLSRPEREALQEIERLISRPSLGIGEVAQFMRARGLNPTSENLLRWANALRERYPNNRIAQRLEVYAFLQGRGIDLTLQNLLRNAAAIRAQLPNNEFAAEVGRIALDFQIGRASGIDLRAVQQTGTDSSIPVLQARPALEGFGVGEDIPTRPGDLAPGRDRTFEQPDQRPLNPFQLFGGALQAALGRDRVTTEEETSELNPFADEAEPSTRSLRAPRPETSRQPSPTTEDVTTTEFDFADVEGVTQMGRLPVRQTPIQHVGMTTDSVPLSPGSRQLAITLREPGSLQDIFIRDGHYVEVRINGSSYRVSRRGDGFSIDSNGLPSGDRQLRATRLDDGRIRIECLATRGGDIRGIESTTPIEMAAPGTRLFMDIPAGIAYRISAGNDIYSISNSGGNIFVCYESRQANNIGRNFGPGEEGSFAVLRIVRRGASGVEVELLPRHSDEVGPELIDQVVSRARRGVIAIDLADIPITNPSRPVHEPIVSQVSGREINDINYEVWDHQIEIRQGDVIGGHGWDLPRSESRRRPWERQRDDEYNREFLEANFEGPLMRRILGRLEGIPSEGWPTVARADEIADMVDTEMPNRADEGVHRSGQAMTLSPFGEGACCRHLALALQMTLQRAGIRSRWARGVVRPEGSRQPGWHAWVEVDTSPNGDFSSFYVIDLSLGIRGSVRGSRYEIDGWYYRRQGDGARVFRPRPGLTSLDVGHQEVSPTAEQ
jgi:hypothetical protein